MKRDALVARLRRVFDGETPPDSFREPAVLKAAVRLERLAGQDDIEARALVALLYWQRCLADPPCGSEQEHASAIALTRSLRPALDSLPTRLPLPTSDPIVLVASCADHVSDLVNRRAFMIMEHPGFAADTGAQTQAAALLSEAAMLTRAQGPGGLAIYTNLGAVLMDRYRAASNVAYLDEAIAAWERAVSAPGRRPDVVAALANLAVGYETHYEACGQPADLDRAVDARRQAAATAGGDRPLHLRALAEDLRRRHALTGSAEDADDAVCSAEAALAAAAAGAERRGCARILAAALTARYGDSHVRADLDRSIQLMEDVVVQDDGPGSAAIDGSLGVALFWRFKDFGSVADLDAAIDILRRASSPAMGADIGFFLVAFGDALRARYYLRKSLADLDESITVGRRAVADDLADPEALGEPRADLGTSLRLRFERTAEMTDLEEAVEFGEAAIAVTPPGHPGRALRLSAAGLALSARGEARSDLPDIDRAAEYLREAISPLPSVNRPGQLSNLASTLLRRFPLSRRREDLDAAAEAIRAAVEALPLDRSITAAVLNNLNAITAARFDDNSDSPAVLDEAVDLIRGVLATLPPTDPIRPEIAERLADALLRRHRHGRSDADAEERLRLLRYVATATPSDDARIGERWQALGDALSTRYHRTGESVDQDNTIDAMRHAADCTPPADPALPLRLASLGTMLCLRADRTGEEDGYREAAVLARRVADLPAGTGEDGAFQASFVAATLLSAFEGQGLLADIDAAVEHARLAVTLLPSGGESRPDWLGMLGVALCTRWERTGAHADLDQGLGVCRRALAATSPDDEGYARLLTNLGSALRLRYRRDGHGADLDEAVEVLRRAAAMRPRRSALSALSLALHARFEHAGRMADVDAAVDAIRNAVAETPADDLALAGYLSNLGYVVQRRYEHTGRGADLNSAIEACRAAVAATPVDHPDHALYLGNLFPVLLHRFHRDGSRADLDEAVNVIHQCVDLTPPDSAWWPGRLSGIGTVLLTRFETYGDPADLDKAITVAREVIGRVPPAHPRLGSHLHSLNIMLRHRYILRGDEQDIAEAVLVAERSVAGLAADHPERARRLFDLANSRRANLSRHGGPTDDDRALSEFRAGAQVRTASPAERVKCARRWAWMARERGEWDEAGTACAAMLELVPQLVSYALDFGDRHRHIAELQGLGQLAARAAIEHSGSADDAWVMLEAGRGVLLGQALGVRSDLAELTAAEPSLADQVVHLRAQLNAPPSTDGPGDGMATVLRPLTEDRRERVDRWQELMETIRSRPGFDRFGLPPTVDELRRAASGGPIVAISASGAGCDALILTKDGSDRIELRGLSEEEVIEQANRFLRALRPPAGERIDADAMCDVLEWMWDTIAEPVLGRLGLTAPPEPDVDWPRIWWIPTGPLTVLPLHAAGHHRDRASGRSVLDRVVSSYTSTARMLLHAHRPAQPAREALAVGINRTTDDRVPPLHMAEIEATTVHRLLGGRPPLLGERATRAAVRSALPEAAWIHFACHALSDRADPARSQLMLADGPITVGELFEVDLPDVYLAYLSACDTATTSLSTVDEAIHIASAFQLAGYPHTVATLWPISDLLAPDMAYRVYEAILTGATPALAVHRAVRDVREWYPDAPHRWASHVHFGP